MSGFVTQSGPAYDGMGDLFTDLSNGDFAAVISDVLGGMSLQTLMLMGLGGFVMYRMMFSSNAKQRRGELAKVKADYVSQRRQVLKKYPRRSLA